MIMFAYASNLNLAQMALRCPDAVPLGRKRLVGWRLVFRGVADCVPDRDAVCYGGIWRITPRCERALDAYEGVSSGLYFRDWIPVRETDQGEKAMLVYCMTSIGVFPPSRGYLASIEEGYRDFGMPRAAWRGLAAAVRAAWDDKAPTARERARHNRKGRPELAEPFGEPRNNT